MNTTNLTVYLPFDTSTTADLCGNTWTTTGTPTITDAALQLDGASYLQRDSQFVFTGQPFSISCWFSATQNTTSGSVCIWQLYQNNYSRIQLGVETNGKLNLWKDRDSIVYIQTAANVLDGQIHHAECDFDGATWYLFLDGTLVGTKSHTDTARNYTLYLGTNYQMNRKFTGIVDEFMIYDGEALHTANFTPPTASDYAGLKFALGETLVPVTYTFDAERHVKNAPLTWRYENAGIAALLTTIGTTLLVDTTKSATGLAFYGSTTQTANFSTPAGVKEVWFKFDMYLDSSMAQGNRFSFGHYSSALGGYVGIWNGSGNFNAWDAPNKFLVDAEPSTAISTGLTGTRGAIHHVTLCMKSGTTNGRIEITVNGATYTFKGNVNNDADFNYLYLYSNSANILFSNIIVSNAEIGTTENAPNDFFELDIPFDVERRVTNAPNINEDTPPQLYFNGTTGNYAELSSEVLPAANEFTVEAKFSTTSTKSQNTYYMQPTIIGRDIEGFHNNSWGLCVNGGKLTFWHERTTEDPINLVSNAVVNDGQIHTAAVRSNADGSIDLFCDGEVVAHMDNANVTLPAQTIGVTNNINSVTNSGLQMNLYEARLWDTAREEIFADIDGSESGLQGWYIPTENGLTDYSPNVRNATITGTASYSEVNTVFVDVDYESTNDTLGWRYEDCAVYFGTGAPINFHVPPTAEIWVRFDVYFDGVSRWYAYDNGIYGMTGITSQTSLALDFLSAGLAVRTLPDICKAKVTQTFLLHMVSGVADGLIEVWCGLEKIGVYNGNVNNGRQFSDFKLRSDAVGTSFTELIISNSELQPDEKPANTVRASKTSCLNTCNTKTEKIWLEKGGDYPFPYLDLTIRDVMRQIITEEIEGEGEFSPITTIWLKFDVYFDGIKRWAAYNINETNGKCGVFAELPLDFTYLANDLEVVSGQTALMANHWQTVILHMESAADSSGLIEVWIDGVKMHTYSGNVNNGDEFTNLYLTSEGGGTIFKNFIASSATLTEDNSPQSVATATQLTFNVWHNGEVLTVPLKFSLVPITPALAIRWCGCDWYNPLVFPTDDSASKIAVYHSSANYALSYF